jgi:transcriptional regulator GlxA family with amidase domain
VGVRIHPGALRVLLGLDPRIVVNETVDVTTLDGAQELLAALARVELLDRVPLLEAFLLARRRGRIDVRVAAFLAGEDPGLGARQLRRVIVRETGLTPKLHARIGRARAAINALSRETRIAEVARACGYADQAHLTRELGAMLTMPPAAWLRRGPGACPFSSRPEEIEPPESEA